jgi:Zn-dependent protease with chaperone function
VKITKHPALSALVVAAVLCAAAALCVVAGLGPFTARETPWGLALIAVAFPLVWFLAWIFINALAWWRDITAGER